MSRFEETLQRDLRQIADRATPSPDAWAQIQSRIADQEPIQETEIIMLTDNTTTRRLRSLTDTNRRWPLVAAAAAIVALAIGAIALVTRDDGVELPADVPTPTIAPAPDDQTTDQTADQTADQTTDQTADQTADGQLTGEPIASASGLGLPAPGGVIEPGRYASNALGVPIELDLDAAQTAAWALITEEPGRLWIISQGSDQELLAMGRLGSWYDATEARTADISGLGSIPPDDIDGFIAQNDIIVVDSDEVEVGGRPAAFRQFRLDTTPGATADFCNGSEPCLWAATGSPDVVGGTANPLEVGFDRVQTMWLVDMGEFEPVYIFAVAQLGEDGDQQWIDDIVQPIIDSIQFGEPAPTVEGGTARIPERVALTAEMTVSQTGTRDIDNPWPVEWTGSLDGDITGTYEGTGVSSPNGAEVTLDWTMDVTIEGVGTGTLTLRSDWEWDGQVNPNSIDHVIGGTGDLEGVTGFGTTKQTLDGGVGGPWGGLATMELMLALPAN